MMSNTGWTSVGDSTDHAQDLARRRLLLERLGQVAVARLQLVEQAHVLDRDHRLVGERRHQLDLLVRERLDAVFQITMTPSSASSLSIGTASIVR